MQVEVADGFGPYRVNADRVPIENTDRPWVYASCCRGIRKAALKLNFITPLTARAAAQAVTVDGKLDEPVWVEGPQGVLPYTKSPVYVAFDADNLYLAGKCRAEIDRKGNVRAWSTAHKTDDANVNFGDVWEVFLSDAAGEKVIHLGVAASGARLDGLADGKGQDNLRWNAPWRSAVALSEEEFAVEMAVPWKVLDDVGLRRDALALNMQYGKHYKIADALVRLGSAGRARCANFVPVGLGKAPVVPPRQYTVRLHFAELGDVSPGRRVFDVKLQDKVVLKDFDIVGAAGGVRRAVVKEFAHVSAGDILTLEFAPRAGVLASDTVPVLSGIELFVE